MEKGIEFQKRIGMTKSGLDLPIDSMSDIEKHYTLAAVGELTGYSVLSLRRFSRSGELKTVRFGREFRVTESEVRAFIERRKAAEIPEASRPKQGPETDDQGASNGKK